MFSWMTCHFHHFVNPYGTCGILRIFMKISFCFRAQHVDQFLVPIWRTLSIMILICHSRFFFFFFGENISPWESILFILLICMLRIIPSKFGNDFLLNCFFNCFDQTSMYLIWIGWEIHQCIYLGWKFTMIMLFLLNW